MDAFWQAGIDSGYRDDGAPGPRMIYGSDYYGGFLLDPDGNSAEVLHTKREDPVPDGRVDHLWIRVRDLTEHVHLALPAQDDATVRAFHAAVYHPGYYGAFVLDPDGHNVEVLNHNR